MDINKVIKNLEANNMKAYYAEDKNEVCRIVKDMLFDGCVITSGGSVSLAECGVSDIINSPEYRFYDRTRPGITEEEKLEAFKAAVGCDFFFCSANALTEDGELINVDGRANRISFICFGPKNVVMIVGINKIVKNIEEGFLRVKRIAAPLNAERLDCATPCRRLGHCIALENNPSPKLTDGCKSPERICRDYLVSGSQLVKDRIKVIICGEKLGY